MPSRPTQFSVAFTTNIAEFNFRYTHEVGSRGEHDPILDRDLFEAVQAKLAANATARQVQLKGSPAVLDGRIFDDRGNRMSPSHSNKLGVRYRYYVSHAILQRRKGRSGQRRTYPCRRGLRRWCSTASVDTLPQ